ncbi:tyrosine-type recombinase/integrase [Caviibacter abscessus]|uniref:tyrosine-type recombinase/integrase n=1 Tax=Caviibacter abscessus TaxID=1766719 RepID=UPI000837B1C4|nr:tyrosine-type recombinase/integrase [Caviibacter abscessus]
MPVYKDKDKWRVVYSKKDVSGLTKQSTKRGFDTKREAKEWEAKYIASNKMTSDILFSDIANKFLEYKKRYVTNTTYINYLPKIKDIIKYFGDKKIQEYSLKDITKCITNNELKNLKLNNAIKMLKTILNFAYDNYGISYNNSIDRFQYLPIDKKSFNVWTDEQFNKFISFLTCKNKQVVLAFKLMFYGGLRIGEVLALQSKDINNLSVSIYKSLSQSKKIGPTKTKKSNRTISIPQKLYFEIEDFKKYHNMKDNDYIFNTISFQNLLIYLKKYCELYNVPPMRLHDLRHSHATILINSGMPISAVADRLGHANSNITLSIYTHTNEENKKYLDEYIKQL